MAERLSSSQRRHAHHSLLCACEKPHFSVVHARNHRRRCAGGSSPGPILCHAELLDCNRTAVSADVHVWLRGGEDNTQQFKRLAVSTSAGISSSVAIGLTPFIAGVGLQLQQLCLCLLHSCTILLRQGCRDEIAYQSPHIIQMDALARIGKDRNSLIAQRDGHTLQIVGELLVANDDSVFATHARGDGRELEVTIHCEHLLTARTADVGEVAETHVAEQLLGIREFALQGRVRRPDLLQTARPAPGDVVDHQPPRLHIQPHFGEHCKVDGAQSRHVEGLEPLQHQRLRLGAKLGGRSQERRHRVPICRAPRLTGRCGLLAASGHHRGLNAAARLRGCLQRLHYRCCPSRDRRGGRPLPGLLLRTGLPGLLRRSLGVPPGSPLLLGLPPSSPPLGDGDARDDKVVVLQQCKVRQRDDPLRLQQSHFGFREAGVLHGALQRRGELGHALRGRSGRRRRCDAQRW